MVIKENDFQILCKHKCYTLSVITKSGTFKPSGYYMTIENALKAVLRFRKDKKYPGKESIEELQKQLDKILSIKDELNKIAQLCL